ncbi:unnamed protein product, partial [Staurois parvus]
DRGHNGSDIGSFLTGQRALGHQASGHLARQRAPAFIWQGSGCSESTGTTVSTGGSQVPDCLARQRASGHQASGHLALSAGAPASSGKAVGTAGHQALDRLARQRASGSPGMTAGHWVTRQSRSFVGLPAGTASSGKATGIRVNWP